jgi:hypothetical protein
MTPKDLKEEFEDTKGVIRIRISKKNRQHNVLKIPKGQSESVYLRRTDNTMAKRYQRGNQNLYLGVCMPSLFFFNFFNMFAD